MLADVLDRNLMTMEESTRLEFSDERQQVTSLAEINGALAEVGSRLWPLDLHHAPADI